MTITVTRVPTTDGNGIGIGGNFGGNPTRCVLETTGSKTCWYKDCRGGTGTATATNNCD